MIELHDVSKTFTIAKGRPVPAVQGVNLQVGQGEFLVITGRSGSGKTTLLNLVAGLTTAGRVLPTVGSSCPARIVAAAQ